MNWNEWNWMKTKEWMNEWMTGWKECVWINWISENIMNPLKIDKFKWNEWNKWISQWINEWMNELHRMEGWMNGWNGMNEWLHNNSWMMA